MYSTLKVFAFLLAVVVTAAITPMAKAGPANTEKVMEFYTNALDADGCFRLVHCSHAHQVDRGDIVKENYRCQFVEDEFWGVPTLPEHAVIWDYESSMELTGEGCPLELEGPYRWFSDVYDIMNGDTLCWMYTNPSGEDIGDSSWRMVITPSGNVNVTVLYDPPAFEGPECGR